MAAQELAIIAEIKGRRVSRADVLRYEDRRIDAAARKIGVPAPAKGDIATRRLAFLETKQALGNDELHRRLASNAQLADRAARFQVKLSGRRRLCVTDLHVPGASAEQFVAWLEEITLSSNEAEMVKASPDHFVLRMVDGAQEVLETTGGSPLTALFAIDYDDVSSLRTPIDPAFPHRLDGVARTSKGNAIGGVRHQFRDTPDGVHARLVVEFPLPSLPTMIAGHRWHLACEFSNWFEAAAAARKN